MTVGVTAVEFSQYVLPDLFMQGDLELPNFRRLPGKWNIVNTANNITNATFWP